MPGAPAAGTRTTPCPCPWRGQKDRVWPEHLQREHQARHDYSFAPYDPDQFPSSHRSRYHTYIWSSFGCLLISSSLRTEVAIILTFGAEFCFLLISLVVSELAFQCRGLLGRHNVLNLPFLAVVLSRVAMSMVFFSLRKKEGEGGERTLFA